MILQFIGLPFVVSNLLISDVNSVKVTCWRWSQPSWLTADTQSWQRSICLSKLLRIRIAFGFRPLTPVSFAYTQAICLVPPKTANTDRTGELTFRSLDGGELVLLFCGPCSEVGPDLLLHSGSCFAPGPRLQESKPEPMDSGRAKGRQWRGQVKACCPIGNAGCYLISFKTG